MNNAPTALGLTRRDWRLVYRDGVYTWRHRLEIKPGDVDCTTLDDAAFEQFFRANACRVDDAPHRP